MRALEGGHVAEASPQISPFDALPRSLLLHLLAFFPLSSLLAISLSTSLREASLQEQTRRLRKSTFASSLLRLHAQDVQVGARARSNGTRGVRALTRGATTSKALLANMLSSPVRTVLDELVLRDCTLAGPTAWQRFILDSFPQAHLVGVPHGYDITALTVCEFQQKLYATGHNGGALISVKWDEETRANHEELLEKLADLGPAYARHQLKASLRQIPCSSACIFALHFATVTTA